MKNICSKYNHELIDNLNISSSIGQDILISKKPKGIILKTYDELKARLCPNCGKVSFYIDNYRKFIE